MAVNKRPTRVLLTLVILTLLALGLAAYFVNLPIPWIIAAGVVALLGIAWRLSQSKQTQPVARNDREGPRTG
jgi:4-hydroxybenzoate polyprenyltransferase